MKDFLRFSILKLAAAVFIFIAFVPFIKVQNYCFLPPCSQGSVSALFALIQGYTPPGIYINALIIGIPLSYIVACLVFLLSKKEFFVVLGTILLQILSIIFSVYVFNKSAELGSLMLISTLSLASFWFFGRRKRMLMFTLILPLIFLYAIINGVSVI